MREIKFRAWDRVNKKMLWHFLIHSQGALFILESPNTPNGDDIGIVGILPMAETVDLMQYTSIKDKNGKEIYEGDILRNSKVGDQGMVVWNEDYTCFTWEHPKLYNGRMEECEIIGNIYENPELVKE